MAKNKINFPGISRESLLYDPYVYEGIMTKAQVVNHFTSAIASEISKEKDFVLEKLRDFLKTAKSSDEGRNDIINRYDKFLFDLGVKSYQVRESQFQNFYSIISPQEDIMTKEQLVNHFTSVIASEISKEKDFVLEKLKGLLKTVKSSDEGRNDIIDMYDDFLNDLGVTSDRVRDRLFDNFYSIISPQAEIKTIGQVIEELDPHVTMPKLLSKKEMLRDFLKENVIPSIDPLKYKIESKEYNDSLVRTKAAKLGKLKGLIGSVRDPQIYQQLHAVFYAYAGEPEASETEDLRSQQLPKTPRNANSDDHLEEWHRELLLEELEKIIEDKKVLKSELGGSIEKKAIIKEKLTETREREIENLMKLLPNKEILLKAFKDYRSVHKTTHRERNKHLRERLLAKKKYAELVSNFKNYINEKVAINRKQILEFYETLEQRKEIFADFEKIIEDEIYTYTFVQDVVQEYYDNQQYDYKKSIEEILDIFQFRTRIRVPNKTLESIIEDKKMKEIDAELEYYKRQHPNSTDKELEQVKENITEKHLNELRKGINSFVNSQVGEPINNSNDRKARKKLLENNLAKLKADITELQHYSFSLESRSRILNKKPPRRTVGVPPPPIVPEPDQTLKEQLNERWHQFNNFIDEYDKNKPKNAFLNLFPFYRKASEAKRESAVKEKFNNLDIEGLIDKSKDLLKSDPEHIARKSGYKDDPGPGGKSAGEKRKEELQKQQKKRDTKNANGFLATLLLGTMDSMPDIPIDGGIRGIPGQLSAKSGRSGEWSRDESGRKTTSARVYPAPPSSTGGSAALSGIGTPGSKYFIIDNDTPVLIKTPRFGGDSKHLSNHSTSHPGSPDITRVPVVAEHKETHGRSTRPTGEQVKVALPSPSEPIPAQGRRAEKRTTKKTTKQPEVVVTSVSSSQKRATNGRRKRQQDHPKSEEKPVEAVNTWGSMTKLVSPSRRVGKVKSDKFPRQRFFDDDHDLAAESSRGQEAKTNGNGSSSRRRRSPHNG